MKLYRTTSPPTRQFQIGSAYFTYNSVDTIRFFGISYVDRVPGFTIPGPETGMDESDRKTWCTIGADGFLNVDWNAFVRRNYKALINKALSRLINLGLSPDLAEDVVHIALIDAMAANIQERGKNSVVRFVYTIIKNRTISIYRRSRYQEIPSSRVKWMGEERDFLETAVHDEGMPCPEELLDLECQKSAVRLAYKNLPAYLASSHPKAALYIDVLWLTTLRGLSYKEVAVELDLPAVERKWTERGRELLRGWVEAICSTSRPSRTIYDNYWKAGYEAGRRFREDSRL